MPSRAFAFLAALACVHVLESACAIPDDCTVGQQRCAGSKVQSCRRTSNAPNFPVPPPPGATAATSDDEHHGSSSPSWVDEADCGSASLCVQQGQSAFCAEKSGANPACAPQDPGGVACDEGTLVLCSYGYVVERYACRTCQASAACSGIFLDMCCLGMLGGTCTADGDCAPGLSCDQGRCNRACSCADGSRCDECRPYFDSSADDVLYPVCSSGSCIIE
jgi:hypothetical protein